MRIFSAAIVCICLTSLTSWADDSSERRTAFEGGGKTSTAVLGTASAAAAVGAVVNWRNANGLERNNVLLNLRGNLTGLSHPEVRTAQGRLAPEETGRIIMRDPSGRESVETFHKNSNPTEIVWKTQASYLDEGIHTESVVRRTPSELTAETGKLRGRAGGLAVLATIGAGVTFVESISGLTDKGLAEAAPKLETLLDLGSSKSDGNAGD
jgi:hypothetical protein